MKSQIACEFSRKLGTVVAIVASTALAVTACSASSNQQAQPAGQGSSDQPAATAPQQNAGAPAAAAQPGAAPSAAGPAAAAPAPAAAPPAPPAPKVARLNAGREITVRTTRVLSTKTMKTGDVFAAVLEEPIVLDGWTVAGTGAKVDGRIAEADKGGRIKGKASISVELTSLTTADGQKVEIVTSPVDAEAAANKGKEAKRIGVGAGAGAAIGAIAGGGKGAAIGGLVGAGAGTALRGDAAEIPSETVMVFELRSPVTIRELER